MNSLRYSIIYAVIRPEISEQLSIGLIIVDNQGIEVRYSQKKLSLLQGVFSEKEYRFVSKVINSLQRNQSVNSVEAVNYLTRYSNNLIAVSPLQTIDIEPSEQSKNWLFRNYVYDRTQKVGKRA
ncbi:MAG: hypothetical protein IKH61_10540 [Bacteroidales bacterium]|jgi:hypothetical protein|nr:hypothetical protein [Bacteroidales bacterium]